MTFHIPWQIYVGFSLIALVPWLGALIPKLLEERRFARAAMDDIYRMNWRQFEHFLGHLFRAMGYKAVVTKAQGDFGVDVVVTHPNGTRIAVQAKHWKNDKVGAEVVQKTLGGAKYYDCTETIIVTTSGFTDQAREMARKTGVQLWGPKELAEVIELARTHSPGAMATLPAPRPRPVAAQHFAAGPKPQPPKPVGQPVPVKPRPPESPRCSKCGSPMVKRTANDVPIWLCSRFPDCNGISPRT